MNNAKGTEKAKIPYYRIKMADILLIKARVSTPFSDSIIAMPLLK